MICQANSGLSRRANHSGVHFGRSAQPPDPERKGDERNRQADAEVIEEPDRDAVASGPFHHYQVGDRPENRQVAGQRAGHRQREPRLSRVWQVRISRVNNITAGTLLTKFESAAVTTLSPHTVSTPIGWSQANNC